MADLRHHQLEEIDHLVGPQPAALLRVGVVLMPIRLHQKEHLGRAAEDPGRLIREARVRAQDQVLVLAYVHGAALAQARLAHVAVQQAGRLGKEGDDVRVVGDRQATLTGELEHRAVPVRIEARRLRAVHGVALANPRAQVVDATVVVRLDQRVGATEEGAEAEAAGRRRWTSRG